MQKARLSPPCNCVRVRELVALQNTADLVHFLSHETWGCRNLHYWRIFSVRAIVGETCSEVTPGGPGMHCTASGLALSVWLLVRTVSLARADLIGCKADPNLICGTCRERMYIATIGASASATHGNAATWGLWLQDPGPSICLALPKSDVEQVRSRCSPLAAVFSGRRIDNQPPSHTH